VSISKEDINGIRLMVDSLSKFVEELNKAQKTISLKDEEIMRLRSEIRRLEIEARRTSPDFALRELCWRASSILIANGKYGMPSGGQEPGNMIDCYETGLALEKILKTKINLEEKTDD